MSIDDELVLDLQIACTVLGASHSTNPVAHLGDRIE